MTEQSNSYLAKLGIRRQPPGLGYLNELIRAHLHRVPYESYSKILDTRQHDAWGDYLPPLELSNQRILSERMGGTCWVLARSFSWLLTSLGFDAALAHMEPGHLCVQVVIEEQPYYVDVGYGAPLFQAYPLNKGFVLHAPSERFEYRVQNGKALVIRTPGPTKTLHFARKSMQDVAPAVALANRWETSRHLHILSTSRFVDDHLVRLVWNTFKDWRTGSLRESLLSDEEVTVALRDLFEVDPSLFFGARELLAERGIGPDTP